ncbi:hypothetical protein SISSUDRAFT_994767 [Sistotremastrum suecicum HHB10207 ss-3]|uniref:Alpha-type protein kinase domain-containing protein n=1 Tax=Sistotremastrum suecicum HHB10207 ss-3 TaxID=1314776 RepID=A0A165X0V1_9AGAM|nr:hypothetical protein SISSUDRAFT_994767 [Sistotremastrum suecicum HHB10207 ss-3]
MEAEERLTNSEALTLLWSTAMLKMATDFVENFLAEHPNATPPNPIPQLRMVRFATFMVTTTSKTRPVERYLLEEVIPESDGLFTKLVHNGQAIPLCNLPYPRHLQAQWCCTLQHIQWELTHGLAFVTDYQGGNTIITDTQIITHPNLGNGLFGEGNVPDAHKNFRTDHRCNAWCQFLDLPREPTAFPGKLNITTVVSHTQT